MRSVPVFPRRGSSSTTRVLSIWFNHSDETLTFGKRSTVRSMKSDQTYTFSVILIREDLGRIRVDLGTQILQSS